MELTSPKLPTPFQSANEDREEADRITLPRSYISAILDRQSIQEDREDPDRITLSRSYTSAMPYCQPIRGDHEDTDRIMPPRSYIPAVQHRQPIQGDREESHRIMSPRSYTPSMQRRQPIQGDLENPDWYPGHYNVLSPRCFNQPQQSLPTFNGKFGEWDAFWLQFQLLSDRYNWTGREQADQLLLSLRDEALMFVSSLPPIHRQTSTQLTRALQERFSHDAPTEAYIADLSCIQKKSTENLQEYASRVRALMFKAYPDISHTTTYEELQIQHFINGLPDQDTAYEVRVRQPKTLTEAVNYIRWHDYWSDATRRSTLRHLRSDQDTKINSNQISGEDDPDPTIFKGYLEEEVAKLQKEDEGLCHVWQWLREDMPDEVDVSQLSPAASKYWYNSKNIVCLNDILYQKKFTIKGRLDYQLLVPRTLREDIIRNNHSSTAGGHFGRNKTAKKIRLKFDWYNMDKDIKKYIGSCAVCKQQENARKKKH